MKKEIMLLGLLLTYACMGTSFATDLPEDQVGSPVPPVMAERGIWGAIAYSQPDDKHGFFWGADKRDEAEAMARKHCENAGGAACDVVSVFRNHRHWNDDDATGFPYNHCAALATGWNTEGRDSASVWSAKSAETRAEAENLSLAECRAQGSQCRVREWVCT